MAPAKLHSGKVTSAGAPRCDLTSTFMASTLAEHSDWASAGVVLMVLVGDVTGVVVGVVV